MNRRTVGKRAALAIMLISLVVTSACPTVACGPFLETAIFSYETNPDFPLRKYAQGTLNVVRPSFARSYLVVAYRYWTNRPLTAAEQTGAVALWNYRFGIPEAEDDDKAVKKWLSVRKQVVSTDENISTFRSVSADPDKQFMEYLNCPDNAFDTAAKTLQERIAKWGAQSAQVKDWVKAQDRVFCHCSSPAYNFETQKIDPEPPFPTELKAGDPLLKADRDYQIAAAHFYAQKFDLAEKEFKAIADDRSSPWSSLAPYMVGRTLIRKGTLPDTIDKNSLAAATEILKGLLNRPPLPIATANDIRNLINFVQFRLDPQKRLTELSATLQNTEQGKDMQGNLYDYTMLIDNFTGQSPWDDPGPIDYKKVAGVLKTDEMTDWITTYQDNSPDSAKHARERWHATKSMPWLMAVLSKVKPSDSDAGAVTHAAEKIGPDSPAAVTAAYYLASLKREQGKGTEALKLIDTTLTRNDLSPSSRNLFWDQKMLLVKTFDEFLKLAAQSPAATTFDYNGLSLPEDIDKVEAGANYPKLKSAFPLSSARVINFRLPLKMLVVAANSNAIPANLKTDLAQAVWLRSAMLDDPASAKAVDPAFRKARPAVAKFLDAYNQAKTPEERRFAAAYLALRNPAMRPYVSPGIGRPTEFGQLDDFQDNWWCADGLPGVIAEKTPSLLPFLSAQDQQAAANELKRLSALGPGTNYLTNQSIAFAQIRKTDPRLPEALSIAIKSPKFTCRDGNSSKFSKQAYQILHKNFPTSAFTKKTKYWY